MRTEDKKGLSVLRYSREHISSDEVFSKILKKPCIVQKKMIAHMKALVFLISPTPIKLFATFLFEVVEAKRYDFSKKK